MNTHNTCSMKISLELLADIPLQQTLQVVAWKLQTAVDGGLLQML